MLGPWHARGEAKDAITVLAALRERAAAAKNGTTVAYSEGVTLGERGTATPGDDGRIAAAVAAARDSDLVIAVVGERERQSGEANNRAHLDLPGNQQVLIDALAGTHKPLVVVLLTGRALAVPALVDRAGALLHAFFPGTEAGHAIADVLFGDYNPGGKEPVTWPRDVGQLPIHFYDPPNGRPNIPERGDYKAHWLDVPDEPLFEFGFGLSYSKFTLSDLSVPARLGRQDTITVRARLSNESDRAGDEVPQLYWRPRVASTVNGKRLAAYQRVHLGPRESRIVEFTLPAGTFAILDPDDHWKLEPGVFELTLGTSSRGGLAGTIELVDAERAAARPVANR
jgi:beta-glucosidase